MLTLFERFREMQDHEPSKFQVFFQTHPKPSERKENTRREMKRLKTKKIKTDESAFLRVKNYLLRSSSALY